MQMNDEVYDPAVLSMAKEARHTLNQTHTGPQIRTGGNGE